jgi:hypothetical protein
MRDNKRVSRKALTVLAVIVAAAISAWADDVLPAPKLLLNAQRLRRLKRDRERKTVRWMNFEKRVNTVPDSTERGFELALYYAITGDDAKGREAVQWVIGHPSARQSALVMDWCSPLISADEKKELAAVPPVVNGNLSFAGARDIWFLETALGHAAGGPTASELRPEFAWFMNGGFRNSEELYALCELVSVVRANTHDDLRETNGHFFSTLPQLLLLSAKPDEVNSPPWQMHAAALALVAIDPNLPASQFLQSWALEDSQTLREGPGVAYELLWADPYLPGVGYQNMDTWLYDDHAHLFARAGWEPNSCWVAISANGVDQENCPLNWQTEAVSFGHLTLIPMTERCLDIPRLANNNESILVWKLKPGQNVTHGKGKDQSSAEADAAGMWRPGANVEGRVCAASH